MTGYGVSLIVMMYCDCLQVDYMALDMVGDRVRFLWNAGGGTKIITHSLPIEKAGTKIQEDDKWYKVSAQRWVSLIS